VQSKCIEVENKEGNEEIKEKLEKKNKEHIENNPKINSNVNKEIPLKSEDLSQKHPNNLKSKAEFTKLFPPFALNEKASYTKTSSSEYGSFINKNNKK